MRSSGVRRTRAQRRVADRQQVALAHISHARRPQTPLPGLRSAEPQLRPDNCVLIRVAAQAAGWPREGSAEQEQRMHASSGLALARRQPPHAIPRAARGANCCCGSSTGCPRLRFTPGIRRLNLITAAPFRAPAREGAEEEAGSAPADFAAASLGRGGGDNGRRSGDSHHCRRSRCCARRREGKRACPPSECVLLWPPAESSQFFRPTRSLWTRRPNLGLGRVRWSAWRRNH